MDSVPDNSKLSELDGYIGDFSRWTRVCAWTREKPANSTAWPQEYKGLGTFYETELGSYQDWGASKQVRDRFSGTIDFRHGSSINLDSYAPTYTVTLVYIDGVLRDKRLHRHPG